MIELLPDLPDGVLGFEAVGEIHSDDYEQVLLPKVEEATSAGRKLRIVYVLGDRFTGYSTGAAWEDTKVGLEHLKAWERCALVTDLDWVRHLTSLFGWMVPGQFRTFGLAELDAAKAWAAATD